MRFLGIDYGIKRIGAAVSDERGILAFPKEIIENSSSAFDRLGKMIRAESITEIVVGESKDFGDDDNPLAARIEIFISELEKHFALPVHKQKEFLTTVEARRSKEGKANRNKSGAHSRKKESSQSPADASAAALILQRYLDKKNNPKKRP